MVSDRAKQCINKIEDIIGYECRSIHGIIQAALDEAVAAVTIDEAIINTLGATLQADRVRRAVKRELSMEDSPATRLETELRRLRQAATPGVWIADGPHIDSTVHGWLYDSYNGTPNDAAFVVFAANHADEICDELTSLRAEVARLEQVATDLRHDLNVTERIMEEKEARR